MKCIVTATNIININLLAKFVIVEKCFIVRAFYEDGILVFVKYWKIFPGNISWSNPLHGWGAKKFCIVFSKIPLPPCPTPPTPPPPPPLNLSQKSCFILLLPPTEISKFSFPHIQVPPPPKKNQFMYNWFAENRPLTNMLNTCVISCNTPE